jgi:tetratricopeptide (TPR) repeat protein
VPAADSDPQSSPAFDPQSWVDLLTVHSLKGDFFSIRTLMVIQEGVERLAKARAVPGNTIVITATQAGVFERLFKAFNNPHLLKEVGIIHLKHFNLPDSALKHFDLVHQLAPTDRDIEQLQVAAALAIARDVTNKAGHSGIDEGAPAKPAVDEVLRKTSKLAHVTEAREELDKTTGELGRKTDDLRKATKAQESAPPDYQPFLAHARGLLGHADFAGAYASLEEARRFGASKEELQAAYAQAGLAGYDAGYMDAALEAFLRVRDLGPELVDGWFNCGLVYQKLGRLEEALASYNEAVRLAPDNPKTWCNLSSVWFELGNPEESEKAARECLRTKVDYARAWDNLASALNAQGKLNEAANACQQAIRIQSTLASAWFKLGVVNFQLDNTRAAIEAFDVARGNAAFNTYVLYYLVMIAARRGELDDALAKLEEARAVDPHNDLETAAVKEVSAAYTKNGDHERAANLLSQITKKHPDDFSAWLAMGTSLHRAEKRDAALQAYTHATELRPENPVAWHNLGLLASDQGKFEEARGFFQHETELSPEDPKAWYDLGVALQKLGREDDSAEAFEHAESLVATQSHRSSDLSAALSIVRRLGLSGRVLKSE